ncbi:hypothetical protein Vi05172_g4828 [Venturia inaequalis]|nr:hypothetical protein Vi05172_g4828 [Venturia inaequalis]
MRFQLLSMAFLAAVQVASAIKYPPLGHVAGGYQGKKTPVYGYCYAVGKKTIIYTCPNFEDTSCDTSCNQAQAKAGSRVQCDVLC